MKIDVSYGDVQVRGLSFGVKQGDVVALIGANRPENP